MCVSYVFAGNRIMEKDFSSVAQSCPTLCDPMDCSMPGLLVPHQLPESTQTQSIELVMPSNHLILCRPFPAAAVFPSIRVFSNESPLRIRWPKDWSLRFNISPSNESVRTDFLQDGLVGSPCSPRDSQESSPTPHFKSISFSVLSFLYSPTLTSIHDYWKNHRLDQTDLCCLLFNMLSRLVITFFQEVIVF